jgi:hypothetical protein
MGSTYRRHTQTTISSLEAAAVSARGGFACLFSTSDEYEAALIVERRAQGRYGLRRIHWPVVMFIGCVAMVAGAVVFFA